MKTGMSETWIQEQVTSIWAQYSNEGNDIVGTFLYGSQNYKLDTENSDIDTKTIVFPNLGTVILGKPMTSVVKPRRDGNGQNEIKDIRLMFRSYLKQNVNFIETLFSPYFILSAPYSKIYKEVLDNREKIARYNPQAAVKCMVGMAKEKYASLYKKTAATESIIEKFGYDPKQLHHILRLSDILYKYIAGFPYSECLVAEPKDRDFLIEVKGGYYSALDVEQVARTAVDSMEKFVDEYLAFSMTAPYKEEIEFLFDNVIIRMFKEKASQWLR